MDHSTHPRLDPTELNQTNLEGAKIYDRDDATVGKVSHIHDGPNPQVIVDVGGFLGIGTKPVALPMAQLDFMRDENGAVHATTDMSKDEVKDLPEHID